MSPFQRLELLRWPFCILKLFAPLHSTYTVAQYHLTHFRTQFCPLNTEEEMICHLKLCSGTLDRSSMWRFEGRRTAFSCIGYPMACTIAGPHSPGFLPMGVIQRTCIEESPIQNTGGCNRDRKSHNLAPSYVTIWWIVLRKCV